MALDEPSGLNRPSRPGPTQTSLSYELAHCNVLGQSHLMHMCALGGFIGVRNLKIYSCCRFGFCRQRWVEVCRSHATPVDGFLGKLYVTAFPFKMLTCQ